MKNVDSYSESASQSFTLPRFRSIHGKGLTPYLGPSAYCDFLESSIVDLSGKLSSDCSTTKDVTVRTFNWVRDNIKYCVGQFCESSSTTLTNLRGSCSNKANTLVALLRANRIPAAFRVIRVRTKEYFGPINTTRFNQFMSDFSNHVFASVNLDGHWVDLDPSDDMELSINTQHLNPPSRLVNFDGTGHALLNLAPNTIVMNDRVNHTNIDEIMEKKCRIPEEILSVFNLYVEFIRKNGNAYREVESISSDFFRNLERDNPKDYAIYCAMEQQLYQNFQHIQTIDVHRGTA